MRTISERIYNTAAQRMNFHIPPRHEGGPNIFASRLAELFTIAVHDADPAAAREQTAAQYKTLLLM
jgi:hypothetical protein